MACLLLAVGDVHGDYSAVARIAAAEPEAAALLQIGDLVEPGADDAALSVLRALPLPLVWVHGNNEDWAILDDAALRPGHLLAPGEVWRTGTLRVAGVGGTHAPTWFARDKPFPGDRRRHYNHQDVAATLALAGEGVHLLMAHEPCHGLVHVRGGRDPGQPPLDRLMRELRPRVFLCGHHHLWSHAELGSTTAFSLPPAAQGYARLRWDVAPSPPRLLDWQHIVLPPLV
jgi:Icc-related predicted phosphoesterase